MCCRRAAREPYRRRPACRVLSLGVEQAGRPRYSAEGVPLRTIASLQPAVSLFISYRRRPACRIFLCLVGRASSVPRGACVFSVGGSAQAPRTTEEARPTMERFRQRGSRWNATSGRIAPMKKERLRSSSLFLKRSGCNKSSWVSDFPGWDSNALGDRVSSLWPSLFFLFRSNAISLMV